MLNAHLLHCASCSDALSIHNIVLGLSTYAVCDVAGLLGCTSWMMMTSVILKAAGTQLALLLALPMDGSASRYILYHVDVVRVHLLPTRQTQHYRTGA